jgi:predicted ferric reductase
MKLYRHVLFDSIFASSMQIAVILGLLFASYVASNQKQTLAAWLFLFMAAAMTWLTIKFIRVSINLYRSFKELEREHGGS